MDDDLDRFRRQIADERKTADEARARGEAKRQREMAYDTAWIEVFRELNRIEATPESPVNLDPIAQLVSVLQAWERDQWLVEIRESVRDQLDRGLDTYERILRPELWFLNALLCLAKSPPDREKAHQLITEMRQRGFCSFGIAGIAGNIKERILHHPEIRVRDQRQKEIEILDNAGPVIAELAKGKPTIRRNLQFAAWAEDCRMKPAKIRDAWNTANEDDAVGDGGPGSGVVKQGLRAAKSFLAVLASRGFPLTAQQALDRLPK